MDRVIILRLNKSVTLIELLIAVTLISMIALGFTSIDLFSRHHVISSDRFAKLQNELSYILEHMTKEMGKAIGDINHPPVTIEDSNRRIRVYIDADQDGKISGNDHEIAYQFAPLSYQINYYAIYPGGSAEALSRKISSCTFEHTWITTQKDNYVVVRIAACWDPDGTPNACGTNENPAVAMSTRIKMPSVSIN